MNARVEAAAKAVSDALGTVCGIHDTTSAEDHELANAALAASDAAIFSDEAVERAAIALGVKRYPMTEGDWEGVDAHFRGKCREEVRAVIAALKGDEG